MVRYAMLAGALVVAYGAGSVPVSNIVALATKGIDLRHYGSGSVSPSNLYRAAGLWPALAAGLLEVAKGALGPALLGGGDTWRAALAGALAVAGHNWSPFLRGAGGRGLSTATGALAVVAWPAAALMCGGLLAGLVTRQIWVAMSLALASLVPILILVGGYPEAVACAVVAIPIGAKTAIVLQRRRAARRGTAGGEASARVP